MKRASLVALALCASCVDDVDLGRDVLELRIAAGPTTTCGEDAEGTVLCLGLAESGQLAFAPDPDHPTTQTCALGTCTTEPQDSNVFVIDDLELARDFGCAVIGDGTICFGGTRYGQLGDGRVDDLPHPNPQAISLFNAPIDVVLGEAHGCVLYRDARTYCWGFGGHGQLGVDPTSLDDCGTANAADAARLGIAEGEVIRCQPEPAPIPSILDARAIYAGDHGTCVLRDGGELRCMGRNDVGQLGLPAGADVVAPTVVATFARGLDDLALGARHGCLIEDGALRCFGEGTLGQLGGGCTSGCAPTPVGIDDPIDVDVGLGITWVLDAHGRLFSFGDAREGALGRAATDDCDGVACARTPRRVPLGRGVFAFAGGEAHACAILSDLSTVCFGRGTEAQTGDTFHQSSPVPRVIPDLHPVRRSD